MKFVNIIIAKRGRDEFLPYCLSCLNVANVERNYDVRVYIIDDSEPFIAFNHKHYPSIEVIHIPFKTQGEFNKAKLLNDGLEFMRQPFDWVSIVDLDMIYNPSFFKEVESVMNTRSYVICMGRNLESGPTFSFTTGERSLGTSQISMSPNLYELFQKIYGEKLYDEGCFNWGAEDSIVSFRAMDMEREKLLKIEKLGNMWLHLPHEISNKNQRNQQLFKECRENDPLILKKWMEKNG